MNASESWDVNRHTERCPSPVSVVWQWKLVSGRGLMKRRSAPLYELLWLGKDFTFYCSWQVLVFACRHIPELLNYLMSQTFDKSGTYSQQFRSAVLKDCCAFQSFCISELYCVNCTVWILYLYFLRYLIYSSTAMFYTVHHFLLELCRI